ncbi:RsiV family protein [Anaerolentibacter hominis]|uniref:RsiV family protein n=1 Tax=Anaerolentibacter hominis TaxID=3079009 RepID=UPI0031B802E0
MTRIEEAKQNYDQIEIPAELNKIVLAAIHDCEERRKNRQIKRSSGYVRMLIHAAVFLLFLLTAGLNISSTFAQAMQEIPVVGKIAKILTFRSYQWSDGDKTESVKIPQIVLDEEEPEEGKTEFILDVNNEIEKACEEVRIQAEQIVADYKAAFLETGGTEEEFTQKEIQITVDYTILCENERYLSFAVMAGENGIGYNQTFYYNIDLKKGRYVTLADLLGSNYIELANRQIREQMEQRMTEDEYLVYFDGSNGFEGFTTVDDVTAFYINDSGNPVVVFPPYQIAPGGFGAQEFEIRNKE